MPKKKPRITQIDTDHSRREVSVFFLIRVNLRDPRPSSAWQTRLLWSAESPRRKEKEDKIEHACDCPVIPFTPLSFFATLRLRAFALKSNAFGREDELCTRQS